MSQIFISYAHNDLQIAHKIYDDLRKHNLEIWFDQDSLLVGQNWKFHINQAISTCKFFITLLSNQSIDKIGYVQKELKIALEMLDLYPKSSIYIIPVRLDDCKPLDEKLRDLHWIDLFPEANYDIGIIKILKSINPNLFSFRKKPTILSRNEVIKIINKYNIYDCNINPTGKLFPHQYEKQFLNNDSVILDKLTNLIWQQSGSPVNMKFRDVHNWIDELNNRKFGGFQDWRIPTLDEAISLIEPKNSKVDLFISPIFDRNQNRIWTSDIVEGKNWSWIVSFINGCFTDYLYHYGYFYVRAVRSI